MAIKVIKPRILHNEFHLEREEKDVVEPTTKTSEDVHGGDEITQSMEDQRFAQQQTEQQNETQQQNDQQNENQQNNETQQQNASRPDDKQMERQNNNQQNTNDDSQQNELDNETKQQNNDTQLDQQAKEQQNNNNQQSVQQNETENNNETNQQQTQQKTEQQQNDQSQSNNDQQTNDSQQNDQPQNNQQQNELQNNNDQQNETNQQNNESQQTEEQQNDENEINQNDETEEQTLDDSIRRKDSEEQEVDEQEEQDGYYKDSEEQEDTTQYNTQQAFEINEKHSIKRQLYLTFYRLVEYLSDEEKHPTLLPGPTLVLNVKKLMMRQYERKPLNAYYYFRTRSQVVLILDNSGSMDWLMDELDTFFKAALKRKDVIIYIAPNGYIQQYYNDKTKHFELIGHEDAIHRIVQSSLPVVYIGDFDGANTPIGLSWTNRVYWVCPETRYKYFKHHGWVRYNEDDFKGFFGRTFDDEEMITVLKEFAKNVYKQRFWYDKHDLKDFSEGR